MTVQPKTSGLAMPEAMREGFLVPTLNNFGWMLTHVTDPGPQFIEDAAKGKGWSLDIGCAYGIHTLAAMDAGARMVALDLDPGHLDILNQKVPVEKRDRVHTVCGAFPDAELPFEQFDSILACRVLHFFDGPGLERAVRRLKELLVPGGRVFMRAISPYVRIMERVIPVYEERKARGERWPGFFMRSEDYVMDETERSVCSGQIHCFEPEVLTQVFSDAGFIVERSEFVSVMVEMYKLDGRESVILIAQNPGV